MPVNKKYTCIVCSKPIGKEGVLGTIKGISAAFCGEHGESCAQNCEECVHACQCRLCGSV